MRVTIREAKLKGSVAAISSKSAAHRLLIGAALSDRPTSIALATDSEDIEATIGCLKALGADIYDNENGLLVSPLKAKEISGERILDAGESGSTLRFLLPVAAALGVNARFLTRGRLFDRPLSPLLEELEAHGAALTKNADRSIGVSGKLIDPHFAIASDVSSQFISGLLFALPLMGDEGSVRLMGPAESRAYIDMTIDTLRKFGVKVREDETITVSGSYTSPGSLKVEGDWSGGAFWLTAGRLTKGAVRVTGLDPSSVQGDRAAPGMIDEIASGGARIDSRQTPDLVPVLAVLAAVTPGETVFTGAGRLRLKESDRIKSTVRMIRDLGGDAVETGDGLRVRGAETLRGGSIDSEGDHRIAMSAAIAAIASEGEVVIEGAEAVGKSYPGFWDDFRMLGGIIDIERG